MLLGSVPLLALLASLSSGVAASRKAFQPELQPPPFHSLRSNASDLSKRWIATTTGTGAADTHLWPDKTIVFAFNSIEDLKAIKPTLVEALNLWDAMGLKKTEYKWVPTTKDKCMANRVNCLLIESKPMMLTSIAKIPASEGVDGPFMHIDTKTRNNWPLVLNYAHEIGHAWGLGHEHQNPAFWPKDYDAHQKREGTAFGPKNFNCQNIPNFQKALKKALDTTRSDYHDTDVALMCRSLGVAQKLEWEGAAFLPYPDGFYSEKSDLSQGPDDVDWDSIMLYSTDIAGAPIFTKPDGSKIPFPAGPSNKDVMGIQRLYSANQQTRNDAPLLNSGANEKQSLFKKLFCSCCRD